MKKQREEARLKAEAKDSERKAKEEEEAVAEVAGDDSDEPEYE